MITWIFGRSASGKTTVGHHLCTLISQQCDDILFLDGDMLRNHINRDLGFTKDDRHMAALRTAGMLQLIKDKFEHIVVCMITPLEATRRALKEMFRDEILLAYLEVPLDICIERDKKKLYGNALLIDYFEIPRTQNPFECNHSYFSNVVCEPKTTAGRIYNHIEIKEIYNGRR